MIQKHKKQPGLVKKQLKSRRLDSNPCVLWQQKVKDVITTSHSLASAV
jgi:hypothetical protein